MSRRSQTRRPLETPAVGVIAHSNRSVLDRSGGLSPDCRPPYRLLPSPSTPDDCAKLLPGPSPEKREPLPIRSIDATHESRPLRASPFCTSPPGKPFLRLSHSLAGRITAPRLGGQRAPRSRDITGSGPSSPRVCGGPFACRGGLQAPEPGNLVPYPSQEQNMAKGDVHTVPHGASWANEFEGARARPTSTTPRSRRSKRVGSWRATAR